ncbi:potassium transporter Kup [Arcobacter suis]|uniref:Potassium transporter n=1 Tax=Arcobacter suis CECT 7833 TaxID=663365 RepID=A0AAD0SSZ4_9BACT|nr:KUP/HAK/KT family potassium transporter [Arcobacter suis]AXX90393.1 putative potassium transporter [Arcobacter suis CECT 7833]RWS45584.1 potassium transporter Kup [Arcobacter suis]
MVIKALGVVYGDIGTSPIYTFAVVFLVAMPTVENIFGLLSLFIWTLTILVTIQYAWLATSLSKRGEGGTIVLLQIILSKIKNAKQIAIITILSFIGFSLMIGDAVITPAISILSAVEGIALIPGFEGTSREVLLIIASLIAICLFIVQKKGVEKVASAFGPIMIIWFLTIGGVGLYFTIQNPSVLLALFPTYAINFIIENPFLTFLVLADVILVATGGEALYADMGHLGRLPILKGWLFVFIALALCYFGQGAFVIANSASATSPLFEMIKSVSPNIYVGFVILAILATIIASQAMISGIFSVLYQAMTTKIFPHLKVNYTSNELRSQIYIGVVNWTLLLCVLCALFLFRESSKLASAYGLAVSGAMTLTALLMIIIFLKQENYIKTAFAILSLIVSGIFFISCTLKIPHGGYWSLIMSMVPLTIVLIYTKGQEKLYQALKIVSKDEFLEQFKKTYKQTNPISGVGMFFARRQDTIPTYIAKTMFENNIIYERNIIATVKTMNEPHGISSELEVIQEGIELLNIKVGYMEMLDVEDVLASKNIDAKTIFYGQEEIIATNPIWIFFASMKNLAPSFVSFYKFPHDRLLGVTRRVEL